MNTEREIEIYKCGCRYNRDYVDPDGKPVRGWLKPCSIDHWHGPESTPVRIERIKIKE